MAGKERTRRRETDVRTKDWIRVTKEILLFLEVARSAIVRPSPPACDAPQMPLERPWRSDLDRERSVR